MRYENIKNDNSGSFINGNFNSYAVCRLNFKYYNKLKILIKSVQLIALTIAIVVGFLLYFIFFWASEPKY